jgi:putative DNA primase/helicase
LSTTTAASCPRWERFLEEIFAGDDELTEYVQRLVGYCLTGDTREHTLHVLHGSGCNGKTTFCEIAKRLVGDHAATAAFDSFVRARGDRQVRNDLARLHRTRLVVASESGEGRRLDEAVVKQLTGGDTVAARFLYGEFFEFKPAFKLWLVSNHRPRVDGDDDAIWRRMRLLPFEVSFEGREDPGLSEQLVRELPGVLAWAIRGCLVWQSEGLGSTGAVERATSEYRADEDVLGAFIAERCTLGGEMEPEALRDAYGAFCAELGERPLSASVLGKRLARRGIKRGGRNSVYHGIGLK